MINQKNDNINGWIHLHLSNIGIVFLMNKIKLNLTNKLK